MGQITDRAAVHGEVHRPGARDHAHALLFELVQTLGTNGLDLRDDDVRLVLFDCGFERVAVEHTENLALIGDLHGRGPRIRITSDDVLPHPLGRDDEFFTQFA